MPKRSVNTPASMYKRPVELLQRLIQFDTTNPPGNEAECVGFINSLLTGAGLETKILARTPERPNLVARLHGQGNAPPLLLYGHVDVVTTANQTWQYPPFEGRVADGFVWGRGSLDMKGGVAMMVAAFLRAKAENLDVPGDVVLTIVSDEEAGGDYGAKYLVENHAGLFEGIRYAIGEFGGFTFYVGKQRFYPVMISEKQVCWMKAVIRGQGGHGAMSVYGEAMAKLARMIQQLDRHHLPVHITPTARLMVGKMAAALPIPTSLVLRQLLNPLLTDRVLNLLGAKGQVIFPLLHNTVNATVVRASDKVNVIPSEITVELDGRLLPGYEPDDMLAELRQIIGSEVELEVVRYDPGPSEPNMGLFDTLGTILRESDPEGVPIPYLLTAITDARFFSRLGIQTYGFLPMVLPADFNFIQTIHAANERIPVEALDFGAEAIYKVLQRFT
jgi:acetylornithine deacetylase/succinyl-diaminopimelate desuccinylase-like protein